jgi:hypothetical protein
MMGRQKEDGNYSPPQNKLVQDSEGNEENRYPDPDSNKTKINYTKEPNEAHKNSLKEEILQVINENFIEMLLDMVNQNIQETLKEFQEVLINVKLITVAIFFDLMLIRSH